MGRRILVFTGKGGVGKSVISAATAVKLADLGYNVALVSTDPAHTIAHYLEVQISQETVKVLPGFDLIYIDPVLEVVKKFRAMSEYVVEWFRKYGVDEVLAYELAMLPMVTESMGLLKVLELYESGAYDVVIMDTIPSAEALRLLYLPLILTSINKRLVRLGFSIMRTTARMLSLVIGTASRIGKMMEEEQMFFDEVAKLSQIVTNPEITSIRVIANPDTSSIDDAVKSVSLAQVFNLNVDLAIMNRVLKDVQNVPREWLEEQEKHVQRFIASIYPIPVKLTPALGTEVRGIEKLRKLAEILYGDEDPTKIYYIGKIVNVREEGDKYILEMNLPPGIVDCEDIYFQGDELVIQLKSERGLVEKILPLPTMLKLAKPETAYVEKRKLVIEFSKVS